MTLTRLRMTHFRNFTTASIDFSDRLTLLVGPNGHGKTNILEAVYTVLQGRDYRTTTEREAVQWGESTALIEGFGELARHAVKWRHYIPLSGRRTHSGSTVPVVLFSPDDVYLTKGSPERRRRFLDLLIGAHDRRYARALANYHRLVLQRNRALKTYPRPAALEEYTQLMMAQGLYIWQRRRDVIESLLPDVRATQEKLAPGEDVTITLRYGGTPHAIHTEAEFAQALKARHQDELIRQTSLVGPHRDDFFVELGSQDTRAYASQGQLRTVSLSIKLGTFAWLTRETGMRPIILLDDVLSELDVNRRAAVLEAVSAPGQQTIVTDTEPRSYDALDPLILRVDRGEVRAWIDPIPSP